MTKGSLVSGIHSPSTEGHRRRFSATDKRQILEEAMRLGARLSAVARRNGIAGRVFIPLEAAQSQWPPVKLPRSGRAAIPDVHSFDPDDLRAAAF